MKRLAWVLCVVSLAACSDAEAPIGGDGGDGGTDSGGSGGSDPGGSDAGSTDPGGSGGADPSGGSGGAFGGDMPQPCTEDSPPESGDKVCLVAVEGRAVDEAGDPIVDELASVCGPVCYSGTTDASGNFEVPVGQYVNLEQYSISVHGRPYRAVFYGRLPEPAGETTLDVGEQLSLDLPENGAPFIREGGEEQVLESGGVTLTVPAEVELRLDVEDLVLAEEGAQFRARAVPEAEYERFGAGDLGAFAVYAFGPFEAWFREIETRTQVGAVLTFPNTADLAAGTAVEVLALGSYLYVDWVTPAEFAVVATATVSADGQQIELDAGEGIEYLTWVALRSAE